MQKASLLEVPFFTEPGILFAFSVTLMLIVCNRPEIY